MNEDKIKRGRPLLSLCPCVCFCVTQQLTILPPPLVWMLDGAIGIGIAATAVGLIAGGIAAAVARKKWPSPYFTCLLQRWILFRDCPVHINFTLDVKSIQMLALSKPVWHTFYREEVYPLGNVCTKYNMLKEFWTCYEYIIPFNHLLLFFCYLFGVTNCPTVCRLWICICS